MVDFRHFFDLGTNEAMTSFGHIGVFVFFAPNGWCVHRYELPQSEEALKFMGG
jgi:hypothetical protein